MCIARIGAAVPVFREPGAKGYHQRLNATVTALDPPGVSEATGSRERHPPDRGVEPERCFAGQGAVADDAAGRLMRDMIAEPPANGHTWAGREATVSEHDALLLRPRGGSGPAPSDDVLIATVAAFHRRSKVAAALESSSGSDPAALRCHPQPVPATVDLPLDRAFRQARLACRDLVVAEPGGCSQRNRC